MQQRVQYVSSSNIGSPQGIRPPPGSRRRARRLVLGPQHAVLDDVARRPRPSERRLRRTPSSRIPSRSATRRMPPLAANVPHAMRLRFRARKPWAQSSARGLAGVALPPRVALAEHDRELRGAVDGVDGLQRDVADVPAVALDGQHERVGPVGSARDVGAAPRPASTGRRDASSARDLGVVEPRHVGPVGVGGDEGPQVDALAGEERGMEGITGDGSDHFWTCIGFGRLERRRAAS